MKEEIEKILNDAKDVDESCDGERFEWFNAIEATIELQKLFLTKQIELLRELRNDSNPTQAYDEMVKRIRQLESELKELQ